MLKEQLAQEYTVRAVDKTSASATPASERQPAPSLPRVLVVDDNAVTQRLLGHMLGTEYAVDVASGVDEALGKAAENAYDLFVLDIDLGERRTGVEVMHQLRERAEYGRTPFVACTAYALPGLRDRFLEAGFDAYITKPFTKQQLLDTLSEACNPSEPPPELACFEEEVQLQLPPLPVTVPAILELLSTSGVQPDLDGLKKVLKTDPVTASWVLRHVNTAYYSVRKSVSNIDRAVLLLGFDAVCNLVLTRILSRTFAPTQLGPAREVYEYVTAHGLATAILARQLATYLELARPEQAFTGGLFFQLGRLALLSNDPDGYPRLWRDGAADARLAPPSAGRELIKYGTDYTTLGVRLARQWDLPPEIERIIGLHNLTRAGNNTPDRLLPLAVGVGHTTAVELLALTTPEAAAGNAEHHGRLCEALCTRARRRPADLAAFLEQEKEANRSFVEALVEHVQG